MKRGFAWTCGASRPSRVPNGKGQKGNLPVSLAGPGRGCGSIEERVWDREQQSRWKAFKQGWHRHRQRAHACLHTLSAHLYSRDASRSTTRAALQISLSLPKPSRNPQARVVITSLQKHQVFARTLVIRFAMRNVSPLHRLRLRPLASLASQSPRLAVFISSPSACARHRPARISGRMRLFGGNRGVTV